MNAILDRVVTYSLKIVYVERSIVLVIAKFGVQLIIAIMQQ